MSRLRSLLGGLLGAATCACLALAAAPPVAAADTFEVTSLDDSGPGSLRAALAQAVAHPGADRIEIAAQGTIELASALPALAGELELEGPGAGALEVRRATEADPFSVLRVEPGASVTLRGVTIAGGLAQEAFSALGGGIENRGTLRLEGVAVERNRAESPVGFAAGGGIYNGGRLELERTRIAGNVAATTAGEAYGGGIYSTQALTAVRSTFAGNAIDAPAPAQSAGAALLVALGEAVLQASAVTGNVHLGEPPEGFTAVHNASGGLIVESSTVSGNDGGVGAWSAVATVVRGSTIAGGEGTRGANLVGGDFDIEIPLHVQSSVFDTAPPGYPACVMGPQAAPVSHGHNVIADDSCEFATAPGDVTGVDPLLRPLGSYGGPTLTQPPRPGSPARDAGTSAPLEAPELELGAVSHDQRGVARPYDDPQVVNAPGGDGSDSGAVELGPDADRIAVALTPPLITGGGLPGTMLSCAHGEWTASGRYEHAWTADGVPVPVGMDAGMTRSTNPKRFRADEEWAGKEIRCVVQRVNSHGASAPAVSAPVVVGTRAPQPLSPPVLHLTGSTEQAETVRAGRKLHCEPGTWSAAGTLTYSWLRDGAPHANTTSTNPSKYLPSPADVGHEIACRVERANKHGSAAADSAPVAVLAP